MTAFQQGITEMRRIMATFHEQVKLDWYKKLAAVEEALKLDTLTPRERTLFLEAQAILNEGLARAERNQQALEKNWQELLEEDL